MPPRSELKKIYEYAKSLGNNDLRALIAELNEENTRRERKQEKEDWNVVRNAITDYIERWGTISVYGYGQSMDITRNSFLGSIGQIDITY